MAKTKYSYNHKTLRYERTGIRWASVIFGALSVVVFGGLLFVGMVFLQNKLFESQEEARLKKENETLLKHKEIVADEVLRKGELLASLYDHERELHKKIFLTDKPVDDAMPGRGSDILAYELPDFRELTTKLVKETTSSIGKASISNFKNAKLYWPSSDDMAEIQYYPTLTPIKNFEFKNLASGFGNQINPFNKRMYRHNGIDIICERGTEVRATGKGTVIVAKHDETPGGKGSYVVIEHVNGYQTRYAHLSLINVVYGQKVSQGQIIGAVGTTGSAVAPHLHYEILKKGSLVNPVLFFVEELSESELYRLAKLNTQVKQSLD